MANTKKKAEDKVVKQAKPVESQAKAAASDKPAKKAKKVDNYKKRPPLMPKTFFADEGKIGSWKLIDAKDQTLGRLCTHIAALLMGKLNPGYTSFHDTGDSVVVINASKIRLTGKKWTDKKYHYHTGYPGGIKELTAKDLLENHPDWLIEWAVSGMLPAGHMGRRWRKKLRVFANEQHEHTAQQPAPVKLPNLGMN